MLGEILIGVAILITGVVAIIWLCRDKEKAERAGEFMRQYREAQNTPPFRQPPARSVTPNTPRQATRTGYTASPPTRSTSGYEPDYITPMIVADSVSSSHTVDSCTRSSYSSSSSSSWGGDSSDSSSSSSSSSSYD